MFTKLFVRDKDTGHIHQVGDDGHDSLYVQEGVVYYYNLQNGDGTMPDGSGGYEFIDSDCAEALEVQRGISSSPYITAQMDATQRAKMAKIFREAFDELDWDDDEDKQVNDMDAVLRANGLCQEDVSATLDMYRGHLKRNRPDRMCPCDVCRYGPPSSLGGKPCTVCPASAKEADPPTNADRIRATGDEELAELLCTADWCGACDQLRANGTCQALELDGPLGKRCVAAGLRWLKQPAEEDIT